MDQESLTVLEFPELLELIGGFSQTCPGRDRVTALRPLRDESGLKARVGLLEEALEHLEEAGRPAFHQLEDPSSVVAGLSVEGNSLDVGEILRVLDWLKAANELQGSLVSGRRSRLSQAFPVRSELKPLILEVERVLDPSGAIRESSFPELAEARRRQIRCRREIESKLESFLKGQKASCLVQDPYVTQRNGRSVVPVRVEQRRRVPGVVHGTSSSGATVFVEPYSVVDLNNECTFYAERELEIIRKALKELSVTLHARLEVVRNCIDLVAEADALFACAEFGRRFEAIPPRFEQGFNFNLCEARHPLLTVSLGKDQVVPISVRLTSKDRVLIVSGPNAGGKTVALKTVGLFCLMAQAGLPIPSSEVQLPLFQEILADIGDHQSIPERLSTFSARILRIRRMIEKLEPPSLVLLDEVGSGTDPAQGGALGTAVVEFFRNRPTIVVATTHHEAIKQYGFSTPGVVNAGVILDEKTLQPTYHLRLHEIGASSGLEVAARLGLPSEVIDKARSMLDPRRQQVEEYLRRLRRELGRLERKRRGLDHERKELTARHLELDAEFERRKREFENRAEAAIEEWTDLFRHRVEEFLRRVNDRLEAARVRKESRKREALLKEAFRRRMSLQETSQAETGEASTDGGIETGDWIYHSFFRKRGRVVAVSDEELIVEVEGKRIASSRDQVRKIEEKETLRKPSQGISLQVVEESDPELNLIGSTVEEALERADKFLDRAFLSQLKEVRLIHGFGTGRLRSALAEFLKQHPQVSRIQADGGATIVQLRD